MIRKKKKLTIIQIEEALRQIIKDTAIDDCVAVLEKCDHLEVRRWVIAKVKRLKRTST